MRILAVHSGALGDVILFGHLLAGLEGHVTLLAGGEKGKLLAGVGAVAAALDFDALPMHEVFSDTPLDQCRLPSLLGEHDRLISCFGAGDAKAQLRLAALCSAGNAAFLPIRPPPDAPVHLLEVWRDLLGLDNQSVHEEVAWASRPCVPGASRPWRIPQAWPEAGRALLARCCTSVDLSVPPPRVLEGSTRRGCIFFHPGAGSAAKCWPLDRFLETARRVAAEGLGRPVFVLGPAETERWGKEKLQVIGQRFALMQSPPLPALAGLLAEATAFVGNDSGVSHLAAAVATPTLALFGPTRASQFAPTGPAVKTIQADAMDRIEPAQVMVELHAMINAL